MWISLKLMKLIQESIWTLVYSSFLLQQTQQQIRGSTTRRSTTRTIRAIAIQASVVKSCVALEFCASNHSLSSSKSWPSKSTSNVLSVTNMTSCLLDYCWVKVWPNSRTIPPFSTNSSAAIFSSISSWGAALYWSLPVSPILSSLTRSIPFSHPAATSKVITYCAWSTTALSKNLNSVPVLSLTAS